MDTAGNFGSGSSDTVVLERPPQAPEDILLDTDSINENLDTSAADLLFANLSAVDADEDDTHSYELVSGVGDTDNGRFLITADRLLLRQGETIDHETQASYSVRVRVTDGAGLVFEKSLTLGVNNLVEVTKEDITVGDGTAQRSRVESLSIQFDAEVTIAPGAFTVIKRGPDGGTVDVAYTTRLDEDGHTIADLTFSGTFVEYGSLVDGNYQLTIDGTKIENLEGFGFDSGGDGFTGDQMVTGDAIEDHLYRLNGDGNGDRFVDFGDIDPFLAAFGSNDPTHDYNRDGFVDFADIDSFLALLGRSLDFE